MSYFYIKYPTSDFILETHNYRGTTVMINFDMPKLS
jgi:hypothetical protein